MKGLYTMIRRIQEADAARLAELDAELFPEICWNENTLRKEIRLGWGLVAVSAKEEVFGFLLTRLDGQMVDITRVGVSKKKQSKGYGRALLRRAIEDLDSPMMLTVRQDNVIARKLYLSEGFTATSITLEDGLILIRARE